MVSESCETVMDRKAGPEEQSFSCFIVSRSAKEPPILGPAEDFAKTIEPKFGIHNTLFRGEAAGAQRREPSRVAQILQHWSKPLQVRFEMTAVVLPATDGAFADRLDDFRITW